ncbi:MAG TPA: DUF2207 domain-containing protein [Streptosporangiaceae bacterium]|nr:DUF2207 domain-containing protein [Streptosporangiaceae bacterium]
MVPGYLRIWRAAALLLVSLIGVLAIPAPARAETERIARYQVDMEVRPDGLLHVKETIAYDFGSVAKHGVDRYVPRLVPSGPARDRLYALANVRVSSPAGAPVPAEMTSGDETRIRIGDPARTVTGAQTYVIDYDVRAALSPHPGHDELYWNAVGNGWRVPISDVTVTVSIPVAVTGATCFAGPAGATRACGSANAQGTTARFTQPSLDPRTGLTVAVKWAKGAVTVPPPVYRERLATSVSPVAIAIAGALLLVPLLMFLRGLPRGRARAALVSVPPPGVRPAEAGALLDDRADIRHVVATLVDLAARGRLRIEDTDGDYLLTRTGPLDLHDLAPYEATLLKGVLGGQEEVLVSRIHVWFGSVRVRTQDQLMDELVRRGWYRRRPDLRRRGQRVLGGVMLGLSPFGFALGLLGSITFAGAFTIVAALAVAGLAVVLLARTVRPRTTLGSQVLGQVKGFREHLRGGPVPEGTPEQIEEAVSRLVPFAIAFGLQRGYAAVLAAHLVQTPSWYNVGGGAFASSLTSFAAYTGSPSFGGGSSGSSGGGFSGGGAVGGGGGGGGGGSW